MQSQPQRASLAHPAPALAEGKTKAPRGLPGSCHSQGQVGQSRAEAGGAGRGCGQQSPAGSSPACFLSGKVLIAFLALLSCEVCQSFGQQTVPEPHLASAEQGVVKSGPHRHPAQALGNARLHVAPLHPQPLGIRLGPSDQSPRRDVGKRGSPQQGLECHAGAHRAPGSKVCPQLHGASSGLSVHGPLGGSQAPPFAPAPRRGAVWPPANRLSRVARCRPHARGRLD